MRSVNQPGVADVPRINVLDDAAKEEDDVRISESGAAVKNVRVEGCHIATLRSIARASSEDRSGAACTGHVSLPFVALSNALEAFGPSTSSPRPDEQQLQHARNISSAPSGQKKARLAK